jgi:hypothetical protein
VVVVVAIVVIIAMRFYTFLDRICAMWLNMMRTAKIIVIVVVVIIISLVSTIVTISIGISV